MAKSERKPSFVHYGEGEKEICVGEFHYGSAADPKVLGSGKGISYSLQTPHTTWDLIMAPKLMINNQRKTINK